MEKRKTKLMVITDNIPLTKTNCLEIFSDIKFCSSKEYYDISSIDVSDFTTNKYDDYVIITIVNEIRSLEQIDLMKIVRLLDSNHISIICTDDNYTFKNLYYNYIDIIMDLYSEEFFKSLQSKFTPRTIIVGFVSDNDEFMNDLFDNLQYTVNSRDDNSEIKESDKNQLPIPIGAGIPKLIHGWIYTIWYGKKFEKVEKPENNNDTHTNATIRRIISFKLDDETITYIWVKPSAKTDLSSCVNLFDVLFVDMCSYYGELRLGNSSKAVNKFISKDIDVISEIPNNALNVFRNIITIPERVKIKHNIPNPYPFYLHNDYSKSVFVDNIHLEHDGLYKIVEIDPYNNIL